VSVKFYFVSYDNPIWRLTRRISLAATATAGRQASAVTNRPHVDANRLTRACASFYGFEAGAVTATGGSCRRAAAAAEASLPK